MSNRKERKPLSQTPSYSNKGYAMREQDSPTKASILLQEDHQQYIE